MYWINYVPYYPLFMRMVGVFYEYIIWIGIARKSYKQRGYEIMSGIKKPVLGVVGSVGGGYGCY